MFASDAYVFARRHIFPVAMPKTEDANNSFIHENLKELLLAESNEGFVEADTRRVEAIRHVFAVLGGFATSMTGTRLKMTNIGGIIAHYAPASGVPAPLGQAARDLIETWGRVRSANPSKWKA